MNAWRVEVLMCVNVWLLLLKVAKLLALALLFGLARGLHWIFLRLFLFVVIIFRAVLLPTYVRT